MRTPGSILLPIVAAGMFLGFVGSAHAAVPAGAVKLPADKKFRIGSFVCGFIKGSYIPGRSLSGGYFYSRAAERKNLNSAAKNLSGKPKRTLLKKAKALRAKELIEAPQCSAVQDTPVPTPTIDPSLPIPTATPVSTATPEIQLSSIDSTTYYTENALFVIPPADQVTFTGESSWDSVYSSDNIDRYVAKLKSAFPADYFFVTIMATDLQPSRVPNVLTYRKIADGIGEDTITGTNVPNICRYHNSGQVIDGSLAVLDHEIGHNWGVFIGSELGTGHWLPNSTATGQMADSYSDDGFQTVKQIQGDPVSGFTWVSVDNLVKNEIETFSDRDLYLQGLSATFPTLHVLSSPVYNIDHTVSYTSVASYDQGWVEARNGVRSPSYRTSEKRFRLGFVYVARNLAEIMATYKPIERSIRHFVHSESLDNTKFRFEVPFLVETKYRGSADSLLADLDGNTTPQISIVGSAYTTTSSGSASFIFTATDPDGAAPQVSCVPASSGCSVTGNTVTVSGLATGSHFFTIKAQDTGGKKAFAHFVVDGS